MKRKILLLAAIFFSSQLLAQQDSSAVLDEVVITANKLPHKRSETGKVISVITRAQLERAGGQSIGELLNTMPGTTIIGANNAPGTNLTASIRGASAGNTLILLDGIPVSDPSVNTNYFDLNFIRPDQIERIEVLKGGQSTLYGSDAVAGVINIITRKGKSGKPGISAGLSAGTYGSFTQDLAVSGQTGKLNYSAGYSHLLSQGFSAATDTVSNASFDRDGVNQHASHLQLAYQLSKRSSLQLLARYNRYKADLDASGFVDEQDYTVDNDQAQFGLGWTLTHRMGTLRMNYNFNYVERAYRDDSTYRSSPFVDYSNSSYIGRTHFAELYSDFNWKQWQLLAGFDFRGHNTYQYYFSNGPWGPYESGPLRANMQQYSPYLNLRFKPNSKFLLEAGSRLNIHSEYGSNFTFSFNPSYQLNKTFQFFANLYSAFKTPTLYQLFDPAAGNINLKPEEGLIGEAGLAIRPTKNSLLRAVGFWRRSRNTIQYVTVDPANFISQYQNLSRQVTYGFELEQEFRSDKWTIRANYAYTNGKTKSAADGTGSLLGKDTSYFNLYRIPKHAINLQIGYQFTSALFVQIQSRTISDREEFIYGSAPETLKGYTLVDAYAEYRVKKWLTFFGDLRNLTDANYTDWRGFNTRGLNFTIGIRSKLN